jgi:transposase
MKFLTDNEEIILRAQHRLERDGRVRDRIKAILLYNDGWPPPKIAKVLMIDESTVRRHLEEYEENHKLKPENGGSQSKLSASQTDELIAHLETTTYVKAQAICEYVQTTYDIIYTVPGMTSWLKAHGFVHKKPKGTPAKADPVRQAAFIEAYETLMNTIGEDEPVEFCDAVHPTMATKITFGWIRKGKDKLIATVASRTRLNLLGSLNLQTMEITIDAYETIDSKATEAHFKKLREKYPKAPYIHLILDRGPYNISRETHEAALKYGIKIHLLPPYSPNLNPIERLWKIMNEQVRNNQVFHKAKDFKAAIMNFFALTWPQIAQSMVDRINDNFQILKPASSS